MVPRPIGRWRPRPWGGLLERYVVREIARPALVVSAVLVVVFVGYLLGRFLGDVVDGVLPSGTLALLLLLRTAIALEVLLPITLFLCVVMALGRLHADSEIIAMSALGVSPARVVRAVAGLGMVLGLGVAALSLVVRPWAYEESYRLRAEAGAEVDLDRLQAGRFYARQRGEYVVFAEHSDAAAGRLSGVFVHSEERGVRHVLFAREAHQRIDPVTGERTLVALHGHHYRIATTEGPDRIVGFARMEMPLRTEPSVPEYRRKAASTATLARSGAPMDIAELQWRLTTPVATVFLALLGIPLGRAVPRQGRYARFAAAVVAYAAYYNVKAMAKTWVEHGSVGPVPGLWWVDVLLGGVVLLALWRPWPPGWWRR
jgi:lipopolysaccharide export system permease protein